MGNTRYYGERPEYCWVKKIVLVEGDEDTAEG
jgi:hypothetical protein